MSTRPPETRCGFGQTSLPEAALWGDDELVLLATSTESTARVFRLTDGQEVGQRKVPRANRRWSTLGRDILTWTEEKRDGHPVWVVRMFDPWTQQDRWQRIFQAESRGYVTAEHELAVVEPNGSLTVLDLASGQPRLQQYIELAPNKLLSINLFSTESQDLLLCGTRPNAEQGMTISSFPDAQSAPLLDTAVYAFHRPTGQPQWQVPAVIQGYSVPLNQPPGLPVLAFVRQFKRSQGEGRPRSQLAVLCLDKRDGRILLDRDDLKFSFGNLLLVGDAEQHQVSLRLMNANGFQLKFTDEPQAPRPPAQTGTASSRRRGGSLSGILNAVFDAFGKQVREQGERGEQEVRRMIERAEGQAPRELKSVE